RTPVSPLRTSWRGISASLLFLSTVLVNGCGSDGSDSSIGKPFANVVFLGDSLTAGYQNGSLLDSQQKNGYAALIATQANFSLTLPLITPPGAPAVLQLVKTGPPPVIVTASGTTTGRDNPTEQPNDLAVPGHLLHDILNTTPSAIAATGQQLMTNLVLAFPAGNTKSQIDEAITLKPSTVIVWAGNNDALIADEEGTPSVMTSLSSFTTDFIQLMTTLKSKTSANLVVANIPDVTAVPYMVPANTVIAQVSALTSIPASTVAAILGIQNGDLVNLDGVQALQASAAGGKLTKLADNYVLTASEVAAVQATVNSYNQVIQQQAQAVGATVVDMHAYFASMQAGVTVNGKTATTTFLGGLFGLDGIHPSNTGYALLAVPATHLPLR
ncbi:SGNH/GDSL hydrolase family protein, partial [Terriglobus sp. YAF25]|uniref:SGNH/GDSL hydrolase family protein n=1 Tax=Terriglobus sp. YAF25 TaxID=3233080 RepID=UPI003F9C31AB